MRPSFLVPCSFIVIQIFNALNDLLSCGPYSENQLGPAARPRVDCSRYSGVSIKVSRWAFSSRTSMQPASNGMCIHLCKSSAIESARLIPVSSGLTASDIRAMAPIAPSTWNHSWYCWHRSAMAFRSSIAPVLTVPDVAIIQIGRYPALISSSMVFFN